MVSIMSHFDKSVARLTAAEDVREALDQSYKARPKDPVRIAYLNDHLRHHMAVSRMHAHLAEVQALYDLRASVDTLFQALTAEPEPIEAILRGTAAAARPPLELVTGEPEARCANCEHVLYSGTCPDCADGLLS